MTAKALGPQKDLARALEPQLRSRAQPVLARVRVMLMRLPERARVNLQEQVPGKPQMFLWPMKMRRQAKAQVKQQMSR
jgi:hypothetical protein